jgi:spore coat polysaccharide biosynthesis predicted glycosyltransferase SpsG
MTRDPILFRVDATPRTGCERLNRCLVYAAAIQRRRRPAFFLSQLDPGHFGLTIKRAGNEWLDAASPTGTEEDLGEIMREIRRLNPAAIVVDSADADDNYLAELCAAGILVVSIDHLVRNRFASQLVINPFLGARPSDYELAPGTQLLLGRRYAMVRPQLRRVRQIRAQEPLTPFRALVTLADIDFQENPTSIINLLLPMARLEKIDIVARQVSPALDNVRELVAEHPDRLELATEPAEVAAKVARCHFALTRGDTWSLELACVGIPQIIMGASESHLITAQRLEDEGVAMHLGPITMQSPVQLRQAVQDILSDPFERQTMSRSGRKFIDGRGPDRLVTALEVMLHPASAAGRQLAA